MESPKRRKAAADAPRREIGRPDYSANPRIALSVPGDCSGQRVDQVLARLLAQHSRSRLQGWIREGRVAVGGTPIVEPRHKLWGGETIEVAEARDERAEPSAAENIPLQVVYEDDSLLVIDKPAGLVVHPGNGNWCGTLLNALLHHVAQIEKVPRAGIVHRLDKDTSGLMVVAKTLAAQTDLVRQLQARTVKRHYQALARGNLEGGGTIDAPVGRHPTLRTRMAVVANGRPARTHYRGLESFIGCTLIECALETGRTHQIRVHLTALGHPLVGDPVYGRALGGVPQGPCFPRQALHACRLSLTHPDTGRAMSWKSALPDDMALLIETLRQETRLLAAGVNACEGLCDEASDVRNAARDINPGSKGICGDDCCDELPDEQ
ncbi:MAG TPA: 23S rRNA pseudouridine(1911/1915/1917) synthase RluD [Accumulibacter sp.]|uniref:23S rRNA pseudouridine(1911/1915/1917) synthase RluD n=1 Tax=Accumulibacter sp. TaxID=2053492 RepID=UPI0025E99755|nr:23S rRNA pseudouridine(1911/1915/1917) synthase RluD [Accumulibacter sp.]MCM8598664.1 23S rRNA pseudouridine(1911/1915/1917) synthase RluD [Accumulibacter sp.]MCM8662845.1 23S rRNA pseudouridine(1911/1915/1917) synthase RluD [Accumulibacter sp.]HNC50866.1 23S rRNA pseudouridine(1911/1915/1917) synthase RluD [Accumulibacter sp.]